MVHRELADVDVVGAPLHWYQDRHGVDNVVALWLDSDGNEVTPW